jgi:RNAse (barnase) inhibitor barstar
MLQSTYNALSVPEKNQFIAVIDGKRCKTMPDLYVQLNAALQLPEYFGGNLDGLYDCLCDFSWIEQQHVQLIFTRSELLLSNADATEKEALLETLKEAEANQYEPERSFEVILLAHDKG